MTPAIQKQIDIHTQPETEAAAQSLNLSRIFKKMKPFPEKMARPPLIVALDLGRGRWHAVFLSARNSGHRDFTGMGKAQALLTAIRSEMRLLRLTETRDVVACYESGRDGWWIAEYLEAHGVACVVLSADVLSGNARASKTDRLDAGRLAVRLGRFFDGELECDHVVLRPRPDILEERAVSRGRAEAVAMRTRLGNQFKSILALHMEVPPGLDIRKADVDGLRDALGRPLPPAEAEELKRLQRHFKEMDADVDADDRRMKGEMSAASARGRRRADAAGGHARGAGAPEGRRAADRLGPGARAVPQGLREHPPGRLRHGACRDSAVERLVGPVRGDKPPVQQPPQGDARRTGMAVAAVPAGQRAVAVVRRTDEGRRLLPADAEGGDCRRRPQAGRGALEVPRARGAPGGRDESRREGREGRG